MIQPMRRTTLLAAAAAALLYGASSHAACSAADIDGSAMPSGTIAGRTLAITPTTESIKVNYGETVKIVTQAGQEVTWKFDGLASSLPLGQVTALPSASRGGSAQAAPKVTDIPIYVDHSRNPLSVMHPVCLGF